MNAMEIILLIVGAIIFVAGYFVPVKKEELQEDTKEQLEKEIKEMVSNEMETVKEKVDGIVDETITYAVEKTERTIEKITNGNIMAVKEYSDTVLEGINKNHKEVLFMYDMLNDKQESLKDTVALVDSAAKNVGYPENPNEIVDEAIVDSVIAAAEEEIVVEKEDNVSKPREVSIQFSNEDVTEKNKNERILELKRSGKSNVAIAKELGLGVGEVKLVIDLFVGTDPERKM